MALSDEPVRYKSTSLHYLLLFVILLFWMFLGFNVVQYSIITVTRSPISWMYIGSLTLLGLAPSVALIAWRVKQRSIFTEPDWNFKRREVGVTEFKIMQREYHRAYSHLIARLDPVYLLLVLVSFSLAISSPLVVALLVPGALIYAPLLFGFAVLPFGVTLFVFILRLVPTDTTMHFPHINVKSLGRLLAVLWETPGVSWAGLSLEIGEAGGYFTFRDISLIGRLDAIESVACIILPLQSGGAIHTVRGEFLAESNATPMTLEATAADLSSLPEILGQMVIRLYRLYVDAKGHDPFVDEVLEELNIATDESSSDDQ